jgi:hypothetical protein
MTITDLIDVLEKHRQEVGCDGKGIHSHSDYPSRVRFHLTNPEIDLFLELESTELDYRLGCMCPEGIVFNLQGIS